MDSGWITAKFDEAVKGKLADGNEMVAFTYPVSTCMNVTLVDV